MDIGQTTHASGGKDLVLPPVEGGYVGVWVGRDGDLHIQVQEYGRAIYFDATYSGPMSGGVAEAGIAGFQEVVVAGGNGIRRPMGGGRLGKGKGRGIVG